MDELLRLIDECKEISTIVEGKKDFLTLKKFGFKKIYTINKALFLIGETFNRRETVQILTDFDKEGKKLYSRLKKELARQGVKIDNRLRNNLSKTKISHIEGLYSHIKNNLINH